MHMIFFSGTDYTDFADYTGFTDYTDFAETETEKIK